MKAGGVAKAICDAGGESIQKECNAIIQKLGIYLKLLVIMWCFF